MYRLYLDEVGTDDLTHTEKDKHRFLSLTGLIMDVGHARDELEPKLDWIKSRIFGHDPDDPLVFHRKEILGLKGPYGCLSDTRKRDLFNKSILRVIDIIDYTVITALIDKSWMLRQRHWTKTHPYHYLMEIMVEKYAQFLERKNDIGDIMPEARLGKKDEALQGAFEEIKKKGNNFISSDRINSVIRANNLKFRTKKDNIAGLQLCDLIAHPSHINTRFRMNHEVNLGEFSTKVVEILEKKKYDRSLRGKILGYGVKHLP